MTIVEQTGLDPIALCNQLAIPLESIAARGLQRYPEADNLLVAEISATGREFLLTPAAAAAWQAMKQAAAADGAVLYVVSAFRSVDHQARIIRGKLAAGMDIVDILTVLAPPGFSEHHTGRAVDLTTPDSPAVQVGFERTAAFAWLKERAGEFGFVLSYPCDNNVGYQYEPWHWCYHDDSV